MTEPCREKVAGILGGMGPEATVDLMQRIIRLTSAKDDIDHVRCIVDNNPKVPSRIKAIIEGTGENPGPVMADMGRRLETWGADFLVIPCNTAHYYYEHVREAVGIPVIHLIDLVVSHVRNTPSRRIGILASTAVLMTGLYEKRLKAHDLEAVYPDPEFQEKLLDVIKRVKSGDTGLQVHKEFCSICEHLAGKGAHVGVLACTELGVIGHDLPINTIDATEILAQEIVTRAKHAS